MHKISQGVVPQTFKSGVVRELRTAVRCKRREETGEGDQAECNGGPGQELARGRLLLGALGKVFERHGVPAPGNVFERIHWRVVSLCWSERKVVCLLGGAS